MKKIMLLLAAGLFFLPSCSKEASEPIPSVQKGDEGEGTFNFSMEGVREDVLDNEGRALVLNPKASVTGNKITKINPSNGSGKVTGIAYFYNPNTGAGFARQLEFDVNGSRISYSGTINNPGRLESGTRLRTAGYTKVSLYVGGYLTISKAAGEAAGAFTYGANQNAIRTKDGMDLGVFSPLFISEGNDVQVNPKKTGGFDGAMTSKVRFRLFGEFVNLRFRNTKASWRLVFDGLAVVGYATTGLVLEKPKTGLNKTNAPKLVYATKTGPFPGDNRGAGIYYRFSDADDFGYYELRGPARVGAPATKLSNDPSYTIYLFSEAEPDGGIRFAWKNTVRTVPFLDGHNQSNNRPNHWIRRSGSQNWGKFHNLSLDL